MNEQAVIHKIGAIILRDSKILVVRKRDGESAEFIIPGGRPEKGESHQATLTRELQEELGLQVQGQKTFGHFEDIALYERVPIFMDVYEVEVNGQPQPASEIKECIWIDRNYSQQGITVGSVLGQYVIPKLMSQGRL